MVQDVMQFSVSYDVGYICPGATQKNEQLQLLLRLAAPAARRICA
jgi:hypothetical protein